MNSLKAIIEALSLKEGATEAEAIAALTAPQAGLGRTGGQPGHAARNPRLGQDASVEQIAAATSQLKRPTRVRNPTRPSSCPWKL